MLCRRIKSSRTAKIPEYAVSYLGHDRSSITAIFETCQGRESRRLLQQRRDPEARVNTVHAPLGRRLAGREKKVRDSVRKKRQ